MRGTGFIVAAVGVLFLLIGLINHFAIHANPVKHTSTIALGVGVVVAVIGLVLAFFVGRAKQA